MSGIFLFVIGSEILNGFTLDTNTQFICSKLFHRGLRINKVFVLRDNFKEILNALRKAIPQSDLIITTGGLGPTQDDLTVDILCELTACKPTHDTYAKRRADTIFSSKRSVDMDRVLRQTRIPENSIPLKNSVGLAPGIWIPDLPLLAMPGFPIEIRSVWPEALKKIKTLNLQKTNTRIFPVWGYGESTLFSELVFPDEIEVGVHALEFGCRLFLSSKDKNILDVFSRKIKKQYAAYIIENPLTALSAFLKEKKLWLATVESCTGGLCAKLLTDQPGASAFFKGSIISYHNEIKVSLGGVAQKTLKKFAAVSRETVIEMASGGLKILHSDLVLAVSGIAGPAGGSKEKPVGTVYLGFASSREKRVWVGKFFLPLGRERFRQAAAYILFLSLYQKYVFFQDDQLWQKKGMGREFNPYEIS